MSQKNGTLADREGAPLDKGGDFFFAGFDGKRGRIGGAAEFLHGAEEAIGRAGFADRGAEVHQGRGVVAASGFWQERGGGFFQKLAACSGGDVVLEIEKPRDDSKDIGVENGNGFVEGEGRDGGGGVGADAGKGAELLEVGRNFGVEILNDRFRGAVEISGAGVVAEAFPEFQDFFLGCGGEGCDIRQGTHPAIEVGEDGGDGRLLEHEL